MRVWVGAKLLRTEEVGREPSHHLPSPAPPYGYEQKVKSADLKGVPNFHPFWGTHSLTPWWGATQHWETSSKAPKGRSAS